MTWTIFLAFFSLVVSIMAFFKERIFRPNIRIHDNFIPPYSTNSGSGDNEAFHFRLLIENTDHTPAKNIEIWVLELKKWNTATKSWDLFKNFVPIALSWSHSVDRNTIMQSLTSKQFKLCDFACLQSIKSSGGTDLEKQIAGRIPSFQFTIITGVTPTNNYTTLKEQGEYKATLSICAENAKAKNAEISFTVPHLSIYTARPAPELVKMQLLKS